MDKDFELLINFASMDYKDPQFYLEYERSAYDDMSLLTHINEDSWIINRRDAYAIISNPFFMLMVFCGGSEYSDNWGLLDDLILPIVINDFKGSVVDYFIDLLYDKFGEDCLFVFKNSYIMDKLYEESISTIHDIREDAIDYNTEDGYGEIIYDMRDYLKEMMQIYKEYRVNDGRFYLLPAIDGHNSLDSRFPPKLDPLIYDVLRYAGYSLKKFYSIIEDEMSAELQSDNKLFDLDEVRYRICNRFRNEIIEIVGTVVHEVRIFPIDVYDLDIEHFVDYCMFSLDELFSIFWAMFNGVWDDKMLMSDEETSNRFYKKYINQALWMQRILNSLFYAY